jgi:hypothetical protein
MSFVAPVFFAAAVGAALVVVGLHFIVMRQPPNAVFPTARFLPARPAVARTVARAPEDLLLLAARVLALLLIGAGFARPVVTPHRARVVPIVMVDRSRAVANAREVADSVRGVLEAVGATTPAFLVLFDSSAHSSQVGAMDSVPTVPRVEARGNVSSALVAAYLAAARIRNRADSIELTLVSPLAAEEIDAATDSIRAVWPGAVRLVRVGTRVDSAGTRPTIDWPSDGHARGTVARPIVDTVRAVVAGETVVVAPFVRRWGFGPGAPSRVIMRWVDGEPAAIERTSGAGCEHDVAVPVPSEGDLVLRSEWRRLVEVVEAGCGREVAHRAALPAAWVSDAARPWRVASGRVGAADTARSPLVIWLLAAGLLMLLVEPAVRGWRWGAA